MLLDDHFPDPKYYYINDEFKGLQQGGGGLNHQAVWNNVLFFLFLLMSQDESDSILNELI